MLASGASPHRVVAITGPVIYHEQTVEVVPKLEADQYVTRLEHDLAECYRLTGSDPDGDDDRHLAQHAVQAVRELREEGEAKYDEGLKDGRGDLEALAQELEERVKEVDFAMRESVNREAAQLVRPKIEEGGK